ncbi:MAG: 50S ribosomal protein L22 [Candidatus Bathyarchaeia archaeon]
MPKWGYSVTGLDPDRTAKASGRDMRISPKAAREICKTIRHMSLDEARRLLQDIIDKKRPIPYRRHKKEVPHRAGIEGWYAGRYPVKTAREILGLLDGLEMNADAKGLDLERLRLVHCASQRARKIRRYMPRAFGRASPRFDKLCHVELVVEEI